MIFEKIDFHNVAELEKTEKGYRMLRFPKEVTDRMDEGADRIAAMSTGIELRFRLKGEKAVIHLCADPAAEAATAYIFYGAFQGGWENSSKVILEIDTAIEIGRPKNMELLVERSRIGQTGFDPEIVRIVLPYVNCYYICAEGDIEAPQPQDYPKKTYLAYGSSITHGSLALAQPYTYPFRISQKLGYDYLNFGMAGSARAELAMGEYIVSRRDWDFASVELGINMLRFRTEEFEARARELFRLLAEDGRPVFVTSVFGFVGEDQEKAAEFREIVRRCVEDCTRDYPQSRFTFTDGLELLSDPMLHVSKDCVHPTLEGMEQIVERWSRVMRSVLLEGKKVYAFGDSIIYGHTDPEHSFMRLLADRVKLDLRMYAVDGATIRTEKENNIITQVKAAPSEEPDLILLEGYTNDAYEGILEKLGVIQGPGAESYDNTTFCGAFEEILSTMKQRWPGAKLIYVTVHKSGGRVFAIQQGLVASALQICRQWGISVMDMFHDSELDTRDPQQMAQYIMGGAGSHPNLEACMKFYVPKAAVALGELV